jgi:hypothetical protein
MGLWSDFDVTKKEGFRMLDVFSVTNLQNATGTVQLKGRVILNNDIPKVVLPKKRNPSKATYLTAVPSVCHYVRRNFDNVEPQI